MLCQLCQDIDLDALVSLDGYRHHKSIEDLEACATSGCELCCLIFHHPPNAMRFSLACNPPIENESDLERTQIICRASKVFCDSSQVCEDRGAWEKNHQKFDSIQFWQPNMYDRAKLGPNFYLQAFATNGEHTRLPGIMFEASNTPQITRQQVSHVVGQLPITLLQREAFKSCCIGYDNA
jgi:hypothetical protein